ncbi:MAG: hypothetical protein J6J36_00545 [Clostridia bacterium]|nr:hypothetical protein [Clostridia bacterium]
MEEFDIFEVIMTSIEEELNIPCFFMMCTEDLLVPYCIFKVTSEQEINVFDNESISDYYKIEITLWYTDAKDCMLYKKIKDKLKSKGFMFKNSWDLIDENSNKITETQIYFGKLMEFELKIYTKE